MVIVLLLLAPFGSVVEEETVPVLVRMVPPGAVTVTTIVTVADPDDPIVPRFAVTVPARKVQTP